MTPENVAYIFIFSGVLLVMAVFAYFTEEHE